MKKNRQKAIQKERAEKFKKTKAKRKGDIDEVICLLQELGKIKCPKDENMGAYKTEVNECYETLMKLGETIRLEFMVSESVDFPLCYEEEDEYTEE